MGASPRHLIKTFGPLTAALGALVVATAAVAFGAAVPVTSKGLTVFRTCALTATPASSTVAIDAGVQQASATSNFGTATNMNVTSRNGQNRRVYVRFDLTRCSPAVPSTATVKIATMRFYVSALPNSCRTHNIYRVASSWTETGITWNNQPFGTTTNNPPTAQRTDSMGAGGSTCENTSTGQYVTGWDVTTDIQAFVQGTATNYGWMIRDDAENSGSTQAVTYEAKNSGVLLTAPHLYVTYTQ